MRRFRIAGIAVLALAGLSLKGSYILGPASSGGGPTSTLVQMFQGGANTLPSLAFPFNVTINDTMLIGLGWEGGAATNSSITDTLSTVWTRQVQLTGGTESCAIFSGVAPSSGADTISVTLPGSAGFNRINLSEWRSQGTTLDGSTSGMNNPITLNLTTTFNGDLVFGVTQGNSSGGVFAGYGAFVGNTQTSNGSDSSALAWYLQPKAGFLQTLVQGGGTNFSACFGAFH
jgi:hypothetical protein